jgi:hypothetical protein
MDYNSGVRILIIIMLVPGFISVLLVLTITKKTHKQKEGADLGSTVAVIQLQKLAGYGGGRKIVE